jgi:hypothetical protein
MSVLNLDELEDPKGVGEALNAYYSYLETVKTKLPSAAFDFAIAKWHYDHEDQRCPHDSWVESLNIQEVSSGNRKENRSIEMHLKLLGAFHDGHINLYYKQVKGYTLNTPTEVQMLPLNVGHGDWLNDEIRLSERGLVIHEIKFSRGSRWIIECEDIVYKWIPFS